MLEGCGTLHLLLLTNTNFEMHSHEAQWHDNGHYEYKHKEGYVYLLGGLLHIRVVRVQLLQENSKRASLLKHSDTLTKKHQQEILIKRV